MNWQGLGVCVRVCVSIQRSEGQCTDHQPPGRIKGDSGPPARTPPGLQATIQATTLRGPPRMSILQKLMERGIPVLVHSYCNYTYPLPTLVSACTGSTRLPPRGPRKRFSQTLTQSALSVSCSLATCSCDEVECRLPLLADRRRAYVPERFNN
jgi:hypothetical protein